MEQEKATKMKCIVCGNNSIKFLIIIIIIIIITICAWSWLMAIFLYLPYCCVFRNGASSSTSGRHVGRHVLKLATMLLWLLSPLSLKIVQCDSSGVASYAYSISTRLKSRLGRHPSWLGIFVTSLRAFSNIPKHYLKLGHDSFFPSHFKFIVQ
jgi:hypothetical protein